MEIEKVSMKTYLDATTRPYEKQKQTIVETCRKMKVGDVLRCTFENMAELDSFLRDVQRLRPMILPNRLKLRYGQGTDTMEIYVHCFDSRDYFGKKV